MNSVQLRRAVLFGAVAAVAYYVLLGIITEKIWVADVPREWRGLWDTPFAGVLSWFGVLDLSAALLAAIPVVALLYAAMNRGGLRVGIVVAVVVGVCVLCQGLFMYHATAHVISAAVVSFVAHALGIPVVYGVAVGCRLTTRSSGQ